MKKLNFKDIYKPPFKNIWNIVHCSNDVFAFQISSTVSNKKGTDITEILNCGYSENQKLIFENIDSLRYEESYLYLGDKEIISIRGYGYLTGTGGLNLSVEVADKIQDDFGMWVLGVLKNKIKVELSNEMLIRLELKSFNYPKDYTEPKGFSIDEIRKERVKCFSEYKLILDKKSVLSSSKKNYIKSFFE